MKAASNTRLFKLIFSALVLFLLLAMAVALPQAASASSLKVTFFDVGQGDAALVECGGKRMLVDGGPREASSQMYSYFKGRGITKLDYVVASHPDTDHTGGISGALQVVKVKHAYCSVTQSTVTAFNSMKKYLGYQGVKIKVPKLGATWKLGKAKVKVIGPVKRTKGDGSTNDDSIMLRIKYGSTSFIFTGDADSNEESACLAAGKVKKCTVLKVAHHGSRYSSSARFLAKAKPKYAVISVGADNSYGHPTKATLSRLKRVGAKIYRTDLRGDIVAKSNGKRVTMKCEKRAKASSSKSSSSKASSSGGYIGNINSRKFHLPSCISLPLEKNRIYFKSRKEAIAAGYDPCGNCNP